MSTQQILKDYLNRELRGGQSGELADDDDLLLSGIVDSIGVMRLVAFIEETFSVTVPPEDVTIENFSTIKDIGEYVRGRLGDPE